MNETQNKSILLIKELLDNFSDEEFLKQYNEIENNEGILVEEYLSIYSTKDKESNDTDKL